MRSLRTASYIAGFLALVVGVYFGASYVYGVSYRSENTAALVEEKKPEVPGRPAATHVKTPEAMKGIYMSACVAATPTWRTSLIKLIDETELNSVVVDIKDYSGTIAFIPEHPVLKANEGTGCRAKDMREFVEELHKHNIYVIGRITVFQDPYYTKVHPEFAVRSLSTGGVWKDYKGLAFIDVGAKPYWDYIVTLSKESYDMGFDELNFDYIRFPSDGNMKDTDFTLSRGKTKVEALRQFFEYLHGELSGTGAKLSADLFGMTTTNTDDLNIGQLLENALPYFDYIYPMVYPSHYPKGFNGWANPNQHVYGVVKFSMDRAVARTIATSTSINLYGSTLIASSSPARYTKPAFDKQKLRPWLQDFDYGGTYGPEEVRAQIQATYDAGLTSWVLWDPANKYTRSALMAEPAAQ